MSWFEGDIKITIMSAIYFQLNYENDVKIWLNIIFTKINNDKNFKIVLK